MVDNLNIEDAALESVGVQVGPCELIELIGRGGMGEVHLARHVELDKQVAVKLLSHKYSSDKAQVEGFLREAKLAARLDDAHIVQIYDVGIDSGQPYIVMQYARGDSLRARLRQGRLDVAFALEVIEYIARGLQVAHDAGIVHRDIKPHNIILTDDDSGLKILDFGLARFEQSLCSRDQYGEIVGSIAYMSPEQIDYAQVDGRSDIYSLGITAFQCLTGSLPFRATSEGGNHELMARHQFELPAAPSLLNSDVPLTVSRVVMKMLAKDPDDRYQTADELIAELRLLRRHSLPVAPSPWTRRPLNPPSLAGGKENGKIFRASIRRQRDAFDAGKRVKPLHLMVEKLALVWQRDGTPVFPAHVLSLHEGKGGSKLLLSEDMEVTGHYKYRDVFDLYFDEFGDKLEIRLQEGRAISPVQAQYLYDFLEALPAWPQSLVVSFSAEYVVQAQDVRWIVDVFNLCGFREVPLTVIVGSTKNHDTLIRLGLDEHLKLELELEHTEVELEPTLDEDEGDPTSSLSASELAEGGSLRDQIKLSASSAALVATLARSLKRGQIVEAVNVWRQLLSGLQPGHHYIVRPLKNELFNYLNNAAWSAYENKNLDLSEEYFNLMVDLDASRYEGHYGKGLVFKKRRKNDYASAFLTQAILAAPDEAELFYHRALVRSRMGDDEGALKDLSTAIHHAPRHANAYYNRAILYKRQNRDDLAQRDMVIVKRLNPKLAEKRLAKK